VSYGEIQGIAEKEEAKGPEGDEIDGFIAECGHCALKPSQPGMGSLSPRAPRRVRLNGDARLGAAQRLRDGRRDMRFVRCPRTSNSNSTSTRHRLIGLLTVTLAHPSDFVAQLSVSRSRCANLDSEPGVPVGIWS
jgi:hypothetical protein